MRTWILEDVFALRVGSLSEFQFGRESKALLQRDLIIMTILFELRRSQLPSVEHLHVALKTREYHLAQRIDSEKIQKIRQPQEPHEL